MKCNETQGKWCKNKHGASKIIDTFETYHPPLEDAAGDVAAPCRRWGRWRLWLRRLATAENGEVEVVVLVRVLIVSILLKGLVLVVGEVGL
jgi:hypothetical protein